MKTMSGTDHSRIISLHHVIFSTTQPYKPFSYSKSLSCHIQDVHTDHSASRFLSFIPVILYLFMICMSLYMCRALVNAVTNHQVP